MYLADSLLQRIRVESTEILKCLVSGESEIPEYLAKNLSEQRTHEFKPLTASIFSTNDPRIHKLLAFVFWLSNFLHIWMITRGNTNWTTWPSHVGDNRTECSISFMSFNNIHSFIHQVLRLHSHGVLLVSQDVYKSPAISRRYCRQLALYTQRNCFESVPILVTTPTSSHNLTNDRTSKENNCKIGEVLEEKARIRKGK